MSHRPSAAKKLRKLRKALRRTPEAYIDLVQWLEDRGHADTAGGARKIILDGRVRSESHVLGVKVGERVDPSGKVEEVKYVDPLVPAHLRKTLRVAA